MDYNTQDVKRPQKDAVSTVFTMSQLFDHVMCATPIFVLSIGRLEGSLQRRTKKLCTFYLTFSVVYL